MCLPKRMRKMKNQMQRLLNKSDQFYVCVIKTLNRFLIKTALLHNFLESNTEIRILAWRRKTRHQEIQWFFFIKKHFQPTQQKTESRTRNRVFSFCSEHAISTRWQPPEEIAGNWWLLAAKSRMSQPE
jgi:hypothetical protein